MLVLGSEVGGVAMGLILGYCVMGMRSTPLHRLILSHALPQLYDDECLVVGRWPVPESVSLDQNLIGHLKP